MSLVASVLHLDTRAITALKVTDPYSIHRVVYSLYEDIRGSDAKNKHDSAGILFADQGGDLRGRKVLMLANREPATYVSGKYGKVQSKLIPETFLDHSHFQFSVLINPVKRDVHSKKLVPIVGRSEIKDWFASRAVDTWGFEVELQHLQIQKTDVLSFSGKSGNRVTINQAHITGCLIVTDKPRFTNSFKTGLGRAKTFGCGLLQIIPLLNGPTLTKKENHHDYAIQ